MKKISYLLLVMPFFTFSQVGIGTTTPQATLDIQAINSFGTSTGVDGFLAPRVDRQRMQSMVGVVDGTIVYCSSVGTGLAIGTTALVDAVGYYFFELGAWQKLGNGAVTNIYTADGALSTNRIVTQGLNTLTFTSAATTGTSHFTVDGTTFNVDAVNNRVGIGTSFPRGRLHVASETGGNDAVFSMSSTIFNEKMDIDLYRTRGSQLAPQVIQNGDFLGGLRFNGLNGASSGVVAPFATMADILGISDGVVSPISAPGLITFRTTAENEISPTRRMTIRSNGNVGIGTETPSEILDVAGNLRFSGALMPNNNTGSTGQVLTSAGVGLSPVWTTLEASNTPNLYTADGTLVANRTVTQGTNTLAFTSTATTGTSHFTVDGTTFNVDAVNNRVGIGIATPTSRLFLTQNAGNTTDLITAAIDNCGGACAQGTARNIVLSNSNGTNTEFASLDFVPSTTATAISGAAIIGIDRDGTNNYAGLGFLTRNASGFAQRLTIRSSGNVGIGTNNPLTFLHINRTGNPSGIAASFVDGITLTANTSGPGGGLTGPGFYFESLNGTAGQRLMKVNYTLNASNEAYVNYQAVGDNGTFSVRDVMAVFHNGRVGIGTTTPVHPLQMASGAHVTVGGVWTNASDSRLKSDILATNYGLAEVLKLRPVQYTMNIDKSKQVGFIAQEVQKIIPEVVSGIEGDITKGETLGVSYGNLVPVLTKAIQELNKKIEDLKVENVSLNGARLNYASLINEIETLKKELQSIKAEMNK